MFNVKRLISFVALLFMVPWMVGAGRSGDGVRVTQRPAVVERQSFEPGRPPREMPELQPGEAALTQSSFAVSVEARAEVANEVVRGGRTISTVRILGMNLETNLKVTVWLPRGANAALTSHEDGHRQLAEMFYEDAGSTARQIARRHVGMTYTAEGRTAEGARRAAIEKATREATRAYMAATEQPAAQVNAYYDEITNHGLKRIAVEEGIRRALDRWRGRDGGVARGVGQR